MKKIPCLILFLFAVTFSYSQTIKKYDAIDARAKSIGYLPLAELAHKLVEPYKKDEDKVRSIFAWVAFHIAYDVSEYRRPNSTRYNKYKYSSIHDKQAFDSLWNREYGLFALQNHKGVCSEYAGLFKALCDEAFIPCVIINGYGKWVENIGKPYSCNHAWNAVCINDKWQLLDVTWASGYTDFDTDQFHFELNNFYYLTPPEQFINDHYPEVEKWTLLPNPISREDFQTDIYRYHKTSNNAVINAYPKTGSLYKKMGDSIVFEIQTKFRCVYSVRLDFEGKRNEINYSRDTSELRKEKNGIVPKSKKNKKTNTTPVHFIDPPSKKPPFFKTNGDKTTFTFHIRQRGDFLIWIFIDDERLMAYHLLVP